MVTVYAPNRAYRGAVGTVIFKDGEAEVDEATQGGALAYFRRAGYGIGEPPANRQDPRPDYDQVTHIGAPPSIDAAVTKKADGPVSDAFLPPTNAGEADPHGPKVVSPEIHASGPKGIKPGDVHVGEPAEQQAEETDLTHRVLVEGQEHPSQGPNPDRGPLDASDPGSVEQGIEGAEENGPPVKSASKAAWRDYAVSRGANPEEASASTRAELIEQYGGEG